MSRISFDITKLPNWNQGRRGLDMYMPQLARAIARRAMVLAKHKVPVRTGRLRGSHYTMFSGRAGGVYTAYVASPAENPHSGYRYGKAVHHGLGNIKTPQPWMQDAADQLEHDNPEVYVAREVQDLMRAIKTGLATRF